MRQRAGLAKAQSRALQPNDDDDEALPQAGPSTLTASTGHINLFEDLERQLLPVTIRTTKQNAVEEIDKGVPLAPSEKDRKPWYSDHNHERNRELQDDRKLRDLARKSVHDPLTAINSQLTSRAAASSTSPLSATFSSSSRLGANNLPGYRRAPPPPPPSRPTNSELSSQSSGHGSAPEVAERLNRESSERQRALELIKRKRREMMGSETPSTVHGGTGEGYVYGDQFNRKEVQEAHRYRDRDNRWDRHDDRGWGNRPDSRPQRRR